MMRHLRRVLSAYFPYRHQSRSHHSLNKDPKNLDVKDQAVKPPFTMLFGRLRPDARDVMGDDRTSKAFQVCSPIDSASICDSSFEKIRGEIRIWPLAASPHRRAARLVTVPIAP